MAAVKRSLILGVTVGAVWISLLGAGCNLFRPDNPEQPPAEAILTDYTSPDSTLEMIAKGLRAKSQEGQVIYMGAFADSTEDGRAYRHFFWPTDVGGEDPAPWATQQAFELEGIFYSKFIDLRPDEYRLTWEVDVQNPDDTREERAEIHRHYEIVHLSEDGAVNGTLAFGFADLVMVKGADGNWRIVVWNDRVDPAAEQGAEEITLGRLRLTTR